MRAGVSPCAAPRSCDTLLTVRSSPWLRGVWLAVLTRLALFATGLVAVAVIGHAPNMGPVPPDELAYLPARWDASWHMGVAAGGYRWEAAGRRNSRIAFFPAYPLALRAVGRALRLPQREVPWIWTGVVVSTIFFAGALVYLYKLTAAVAGTEAAGRSMFVLALYPFSLFHGQVYSESLFLLASLACTYECLRGRDGRALTWGIVVGLSRPTSVLLCLILVPLAWHRLREWRSAPMRASTLTMAAVVSPAIGTLLYTAYLRGLTGEWFAWLTAQEGWGRGTRNPLVLFLDVGRSIWDRGLTGYAASQPYELINVTATLFALAMVVPVARRLGLGYGLFVLASVIGPLRVGGFASMGRYTCVLFPIFIWIAATAPRRSLPYWLILSGIAQLALASLFFTDRPVY